MENPTPSRLGCVRRRLRRDAFALLVQCLVNDCRLKAEMRIVRLHKHFSRGLLINPDPETQLKRRRSHCGLTQRFHTKNEECVEYGHVQHFDDIYDRH